MTEERRNRETRQGKQSIRGSDKAANILGQVTLVAASGTLHHVFQRNVSCERANRDNSLNSLMLAKLSENIQRYHKGFT